MSAGKRRACFVTQQYPPDRSGHASRMEDLTTGLEERDWAVDVLAPPPSFPHGEFDREWSAVEVTDRDGVTVRRLWAWQPTEPDPSTVSRLAYYVTFAVVATAWLCWHRRRYETVVTTTPPISTGLAGFVPAMAGTAWVVDVRDRWIDASVSLGFIEAGSLLERGSRRFQAAVLGRADAISTTTAALGDALAEQYGEHLAEKTVHVPTGVDTDRFDVADDERRRTDPPVVVYTGNVGHAQNLDACVRALDETEADAELWLVGGGDRVPDLKALAADLDVEDRVRFVDPVPHERVPDLLAAATVGIAPLVEDRELAYAMPTKVYEYLGCGLPVVTTGTGELRRFVEESGAGIHADGDPDAIADAFDELLGDERLRRECATNGRAFVRERYDRRAIADRFGGQLRDLVDGDGDWARRSADGTELGERTALADGHGRDAVDGSGGETDE